jgi:hypothetical protein
MCAINKNERCIYLRISENNASTAGIFYGELGLAVLTCDATLRNKESQEYVTIKIARERANGP